MPVSHRVVEPLPSAKRPTSVIVIGAGMAGLCAALELKEAGCTVTLLEARHLAGGRVRTRRDFPEGLYVEEGATRFPDVHHLTMHYLNRFALPLITFNRPDVGDTLHIMSTDVEVHPWHRDAWPESLPLHPHEREMSLAELTDYYVQPLVEEIGDPLAPGWPSREIEERYDSMGFASLLRERGASDGAIRALSLGFHVGDSLDGVSALWWLEAMALDAGSWTAYKVVGGNDRLANAFVAELADEITFGRVVTSIQHDDHGVTVQAHSPSGPVQFTADYAICTLPFPLLIDLPIEPPLPEDQHEAYASVPYATLSRVAVQCSRRFWLDQGRSGFEHTDGLIAELWDLTTGEPGTRGVLVAYAGGAEAERVTAMSPDERVEHTITVLEELMPDIREYVEAGMSICWDEEPFARGGGAWYRPGQLRLRPLLTSPVGRLHFAGEGTSMWPGWVQGAFESARRASREVIESINRGRS